MPVEPPMVVPEPAPVPTPVVPGPLAPDDVVAPVPVAPLPDEGPPFGPWLLGSPIWPVQPATANRKPRHQDRRYGI